MSAAPAWLVPLEAVSSFHAAALERWGGLAGVRDADCVGAKVAAALMVGAYRDGLDDVDSDDGLLVVTSYLAHYIARGHCFVDGNKRVAWMVAMYQFAHRGLTVQATDSEAEEVFLLVAAGKQSADELLAWFASRLIALPDSPQA